jgi:IS30 family transposase
MTGYLMAFKIPDRKDNAFIYATAELVKKLPKELRKTFTVDNGTEFYDHPLLTKLTGMNVYFCDPFSPWQRGSNENTNGLLRQFFPKGSSLADITDQRLQFVVDLINNRPRKRFGYRSPAEILDSLLCCT